MFLYSKLGSNCLFSFSVGALDVLCDVFQSNAMSVTQHIKLTHRKENENFEPGFKDEKAHAKCFQIMAKKNCC